MNHFTVTNAVKNETTNPIRTSLMSSAVNTAAALKRSCNAAAAKIGTAAKNENSAAAFRESPTTIPPIIADAERDIPGQSAKHCTHPITMLFFHVSVSASCSPENLPNRSTRRISTAPTASAIATEVELKRCSLICFPNAAPSTSAGPVTSPSLKSPAAPRNPGANTV